MIVHLGLPAMFPRFSAVIASGLPGAAALVSANALFDHKKGRFGSVGPETFNGVPTALDSAGFVAMVRYWFYRWTLDQYVALAGSYPWLWWAAPDFCCEPEIAGDRETVLERVKATAAKLFWTLAVADDMNVMPPMPVLQGWEPDDYLRCADLITTTGYRLPQLVGIGSVCRRPMGGPHGAITIIERLDRVLAPDVSFHLFGVKGAVAVALRGHPRIRSIDSAAWDAAARREAGKRRKVDPKFSCSRTFRAGHMRAFYHRLSQELAQEAPRRETVQTEMPLFRRVA